MKNLGTELRKTNVSTCKYAVVVNWLSELIGSNRESLLHRSASLCIALHQALHQAAAEPVDVCDKLRDVAEVSA